jgi:hypothetical protein
MNTNNSLSNTLKKLLEINANSLKVYERVNEAVTTEKKDIPLEILAPDGTTTTVYVPAFGYMKRELDRLDTNLKALTGLGNGNTKIKLADGSYQRIITSALKTPANNITNVIRPERFATKSNYFFEDFLNPLLTTSLDVSGQVADDTERVLIKRIIFDSTNETTVEYFKENFKNKEELDYYTVIRDVVNNNLTYIVDEEVRDLPFRNSQYGGKFEIVSIDTVKKDVVIKGVTKKKSVKLVTVDKLTYSDNAKDLDDTELLKAGDELMLNNNGKNTRYNISKIDGSSRQLELEIIEGYGALRIGVDALSIYKYVKGGLSVRVNCGFNERVLVFIKAIDPDSNMLAEKWSPGVGLYTNELTLLQEDGTFIRLDDFYKENVADFGQYIKALKDDAIPPATIGVTPDAPILDNSNFKVVQINRHLTKNDASDKIKKFSADKTSVEETIKKLDDTISKKRSEISTKKYESEVQRDKDKSELNALIEERASETKLYNSLVNQIQSLSSSTNATNITPKFRVRGFWGVPRPKKVADTVPQSVVQFSVQYRYLSTNGKSGEVSQLPFTDGSREKTAVFSNWNEIKTKVRPRGRVVANPAASLSLSQADRNLSITPRIGKFEWKESLVEDAQEINFNQLDIAINQNELVEIRVRSISEAGYPANPIYSEWSAPITIDFPEAEIDTTDLDGLVQKNLAEVAAVKMSEELTSKGVFTHVDESFVANEKFYAHNAASIASGFLSAEQKPISVFDKLIALESQIAALKEGIEAEVGELVVTLRSEDGTVSVIQNNTVNQIFAGYYVDEVAELTVKKGHIVTKTFKLLLENTKATQLELVARLTGDRSKPVYKSSGSGSTEHSNGFGVQLNDQETASIDTKIASDTYYTSQGKYDLAPIQYQNVSPSAIANVEDLLLSAPYQSAQRRGQFIYNRYMDVANHNPLYVTESLIDGAPASLTNYEYTLSYATFESGASNIILETPTGDGTSNDFIWTGTFGIANAAQNLNADFKPNMVDVCSVGTIGAAAYNTGLYMHKDHPDLENLYAGWLNDEVNQVMLPYDETTQKSSLQALVNGATHTMPITSTFVSGKSFRSVGAFGANFININNIKAKQQLGFQDTKDSQIIAAGDRTLKMSFDSNDQFLLGGRSCGSFLFMSPINLDTLSVDGETKQSRKSIKGRDKSGLDNSNALTVDIVFQYRMTDYFGNDEDSDRGRIGGQAKLTFPNLTYTKKIGFDIFDKFDQQFTFDLEVFAKYSAKGKNLNSIRAAQLVRNVPSFSSPAVDRRIYDFKGYSVR